MGYPRPALDVKLIAAITFGEPSVLERVKTTLEHEFGNIDLQSPIYDFNFTQYYSPEMGENLKKQFISFEKLIRPDALVAIKLKTNAIEKDFSSQGQRKVNIDPGYVEGAKLVLATTKNYDHRIYLGQGIYGDVHLRFREGKFRINEWTYPDYQQKLALEFFRQVRNEYMKIIKKARNE